MGSGLSDESGIGRAGPEKLPSMRLGKWIAVKDDDLVAASGSHRDLYRQLQAKGLGGVYVFYSPTEEEKQYGFLPFLSTA